MIDDPWKNIAHKAYGMAREAHRGQTRNDKVTPYIVHPESVALTLQAIGLDEDWPEAVIYRRCAIAYLHDVLEDTEFTEEDMRNADMPEEVIEAVRILTKVPGEDYSAFIARVLQHEDARWVKIADILANLSDRPTVKQMIKYGQALTALASHK